MGRKTKQERLEEIENQIKGLEEKRKKLLKEIEIEQNKKDERNTKELLKTLKALGINDISKVAQDLKDIYTEPKDSVKENETE